MKKRALLFGMSHYLPSTKVSANDLPCAENDIKTLEKKLHQLKFTTFTFKDLSRQDMLSRIQEFAAQAPCDSINIIYFSGHGGHSKGENYLYPVDFGQNLDNGVSFEDSAVNLKCLQPAFARKVKLIVIVDACRSNFTPGYNRDYSEMVAPQDTYIAYATQFGDYSRADIQSSYFTNALCESILEPNISIDELFVNVRATLYRKYGKQISNSVNGLMSRVVLNEQIIHDDVGHSVLQFVDDYGDMYVDKYGCFAGDDLVFIDAAQYCDISVLDAIYKYLKLDAERCHVENRLTESQQKLISFWNMLPNGLNQDEFYTWNYRGRPIRLGEIPPLPIDMQKPSPEQGKALSVSIAVEVDTNAIQIKTNLPDKFKFFGKINGTIPFDDVIVNSGVATIPFTNAQTDFHSLSLKSVFPAVSGVDMAIVGEKCRNLVGDHVKYHPIYGNGVEYQYIRT